jgi:hypothetical protein
MTKIEFSAKEAASLQAHFVREKERLTAELSHVELMLSKFGGPVKKAKTKAGNAPKKRGPKSIWGAFILKRLRARNRPMSYDELIADAMSIHKIPQARMKSAKASILNSAFRLRTVHGKIVTVGRQGKKDKLVVLSKWVEESGALKPEHAKVFKSIMGGKAARVDVSAIPANPYPDDED